MKKVLIGCFGLISLLVIATAAYLFMASPHYEVTRSNQVSGTPEEAYAVAANLHTWPDWTYWSREADPSCVWDWTGPESGEGATMSWKGDAHGEGRVTLTTCVPGQQVSYDLAFINEDGSELPSAATMTFKALGDKTEVVWTMSGEMSGIWKIMVPLMDGAVGPMFEQGLEGLDGQLKAAE